MSLFKRKTALEKAQEEREEKIRFVRSLRLISLKALIDSDFSSNHVKWKRASSLRRLPYNECKEKYAILKKWKKEMIRLAKEKINALDENGLRKTSPTIIYEECKKEVGIEIPDIPVYYYR